MNSYFFSFQPMCETWILFEVDNRNWCFQMSVKHNTLKPWTNVEIKESIFFFFLSRKGRELYNSSYKTYGILKDDSNNLTYNCMYTQSFSRISTYHWKLHQPIKVTHTPIMFFHFKLVIAVTTSAKDISSELMAGWEAEPRATGSSQLVINPQEMPAPPSLLLKHHYRKFSQF